MSDTDNVFICVECGDDYSPVTTKPGRKYCSRACCRAVARRKYRARPEIKAQRAAYERTRQRPKKPPRPDIRCTHCGATAAQGMGRTRKFCSRKCKDGAKAAAFSAANFAAYLARSKPRPCACCGEPFFPIYRGEHQQYCSKDCGLAPHSKGRRTYETRNEKAARLERQAVKVARLARLFQGGVDGRQALSQ